jgi:hypothetical protein
MHACMINYIYEGITRYLAVCAIGNLKIILLILIITIIASLSSCVCALTLHVYGLLHYCLIWFQLKGKSDHYWIVGVNENPQQLR